MTGNKVESDQAMTEANWEWTARQALTLWALHVLELPADLPAEELERRIRSSLWQGELPHHRRPAITQLQALEFLLHGSAVVDPLVIHYWKHPKRQWEERLTSCRTIEALYELAEAIRLPANGQGATAKNRDDQIRTRAATLFEQAVREKLSEPKQEIARGWLVFLLMPNDQRIDFVGKFAQLVADWAPADSKQAISWLRASLPKTDRCQLFIDPISSLQVRVATPRRACVQKELGLAPRESARGPLGRIIARLYGGATAAAPLVFIGFAILGGIISYLDKQPAVPTTNFGNTPRVTANHLENAFYSSVDQSPFKKSTLSGFLGLLDESNQGKFKSIEDDLLMIRKRRWIFREQTMIKRYLEVLAEKPIPEEIVLEDDFSWKAATPSHQREIHRVFVQAGEARREELEEIRSRVPLRYAEFWQSPVCDLTDEQVEVLLAGDPEQTLPLDQVLYTDSREFEVVRKLRLQNAKLPREPDQPYGHHVESD